MTATLKLDVIIDDFEKNHPDGLIIRIPKTYDFLKNCDEQEIYLLTKIKEDKNERIYFSKESTIKEEPLIKLEGNPFGKDPKEAFSRAAIIVSIIFFIVLIIATIIRS